MIGYLIYRAVQWIAMTFPRCLTYKIAVVISDFFYLVRRGMRRVLCDNLKRAFPERNNHIIQSYARTTFRNFGKYLVDFFRFDKFDRTTMTKEVSIEGLENIDGALKRGKGLITVTAHLGNWELGGVIVSLLGYKFNVVALSHGSAKVDEMFVRQRESKGMKVIPLGKAAPQCIRALGRNELVALLGDRDIDGTGIEVPFFNKQSILPRGPATLSLHTKAPILPGFLIRTADDKFRLILEEPILDLERGVGRDEAIRSLTERYVKVIEAYIRRYPGQWYMFYPI